MDRSQASAAVLVGVGDEQGGFFFDLDTRAAADCTGRQLPRTDTVEVFLNTRKLPRARTDPLVTD